MQTIEDIRRANLLAVLGQMSAAALAERAGIAPSMISQWKKGAPDSKTKKPRQLSSESCRRIERAIKKPEGWMDQQHWTPEQHSPAGSAATAVAQRMSDPKFQDAPTRIPWERILIEPLKPEFQTTMPDSSMEPDIPRGAGVIFITGVEPAPGDWVLISDRDGTPFVRELRQVKPGRWEAHALNSAFLPMDSERDGLQVLAVFDGLRGRKARV